MRLAAFLLLAPSIAFADQGVLGNLGGTTSGAYIINSTVANPPGALNVTASTLNFLSTDGTLAVDARFSTVSSSEGCAGGGKGGHISCSFTLSGAFTGTLTVNGVTQAIVGTTIQRFPVGGAPEGTTAYNSAYSPFYFSDSEQIHRSDDINGTNLISYGAGQFYGAYGIALDSVGRIYIADTYNSRIVRIDDMTGTNFISYGGTYGTGPGAFSNPSGIALDSAGRIYVLDSANYQVVRMDDMSGTNWVAYGSPGTDAGQLASYSTSLAVDPGNRIYVADTGNSRIVRFDDLTGANWTALSASGTNSFSSPVAVALDSAGKIYVADATSYGPRIIRIDDITGANRTSVSITGGASPHSIAVDSSGAVYTGGYGVQITDNMTAVVPSTSDHICPLGCYYIFGLTPIPLSNPRPSAIRFDPPALNFTQNVGTSSTLPFSITNFGSSPLAVGSIAANGAFSETDNCSSLLLPGSNCTVNVTFAPLTPGTVSGSLTISDDSGNAGPTQTVMLSGTGTVPVASVSTTALSFGSQVQGTSGTVRTITVLNSGTGPLQVASITAPAPFSQTNTCSASVAPGDSCAITVMFTPTAVGAASGRLTILDNAGTQTVALSGTGMGQATLSPGSLSFGTMVVGSTGAPKTVTLTNNGSVPITFSSIAASASFAVAGSTCGSSVGAGAACTVSVTFTPLVTGPATGSLTFTDSAINSPQIVALVGTGTAAGGNVTASPGSLVFPQQPTGTTSAGMSITVKNAGTTAVTNNGVTVAGDFTNTTNCGALIAAGKSCSVLVMFAPTVAGTRSGTLTINLSTGVQNVSLTGTSAAGTQPGVLRLSGSTLAFPGYTVGDNPSRSLTVSNTGAAAAGIGSITIAGDSSFTETTTCGTILPVGGSCSVTVTFRPVAYGSFNGIVTVTEASGAQHAVAIVGNSAPDN